MDLTSYIRIFYNQLKKSHKFVDIVTVFCMFNTATPLTEW